MPLFDQAFVSGDLKLVLANGPEGVWLIDEQGHREGSGDEIRRFFTQTMDLDIKTATKEKLLTVDDLSELVGRAADRFQHLHRLLMGMDPRLSESLRYRAMQDTVEKLEMYDDGWDHLQRRLLRAPRGHDWDPRGAMRIAKARGFHQLAELYDVLSGGILNSLEARVLSKHGQKILNVARDAGLIAEAALAVHRTDLPLIEQFIERKGGQLGVAGPLVLRFCRDTIGHGKPDNFRRFGLWRQLSRASVPRLERMFNEPVADGDYANPQEFYRGWAEDHVGKRRFYFEGVGGVMRDFRIAPRDYEQIARLGPEFVIAKTDWSMLPGDWAQPPSPVQFRRVVNGEPMSLARGALVMAAVVAAAIDRGAEGQALFLSVGVLPACYRLSHLSDDDVYKRIQRDPSFHNRLSSRSGRPMDLLQDMLRGYTVTLKTALEVQRLLLENDDPAAVGQVVARPAEKTKGASKLEEWRYNNGVRSDPS